MDAELAKQLNAIRFGEPQDSWTPNANADPDSVEGRLYRAWQALEEFRGRATGQTARLFFQQSGTDLLKLDLPKTPWLVRGLLPEDGVLVLGGEPKTHKTFAALDLAVAIGTGTKAFGEFEPGTAAPKTVVTFLAEDSQRSVRTRLCALTKGRGLDPATALGKLWPECRAHLDLQSDRDLCAIIASCQALPEKPALLVLDPLRDLHRAEEDKSGPMSAVMGNLRALRSIIGCSVLFVHHTSKATKDNNGRRPGQRMRGSSAIHGAVDGGLYMTPYEQPDAGTTFVNMADVELKAAKGAGRFRLTLTLQDDANGEAELATWEFSRDSTEVVPIDSAEHLIFILRNQWLDTRARGLEPAPFSQDALRKHLGKGTNIVRDAIRAAERQGRVRQVMNGARPLGYVYIPTAEELARTTPAPKPAQSDEV